MKVLVQEFGRFGYRGEIKSYGPFDHASILKGLQMLHKEYKKTGEEKIFDYLADNVCQEVATWYGFHTKIEDVIKKWSVMLDTVIFIDNAEEHLLMFFREEVNNEDKLVEAFKLIVDAGEDLYATEQA